MWIGKDEYRRLVEERQHYTSEVLCQNAHISHLAEMNRFLIKRVNQLEYIFSNLVAKEHDINVSVPTIGVGTPEDGSYPAPDFVDPDEAAQYYPETATSPYKDTFLGKPLSTTP